jgi:hypothetical protein
VVSAGGVAEVDGAGVGGAGVGGETQVVKFAWESDGLDLSDVEEEGDGERDAVCTSDNGDNVFAGKEE